MANPLPIKITELNPLGEVSNDDVFLVIDRSDTTQSANGSTKNTTGQTLKNYIFSGFSFGSVSNHTDVTISEATEGQLLKLNATGQWVNWTPDYLAASDVNLDNVVRDTDFNSSGLLKRGAEAGSYSIITDNSTNWNTAYGWGNHATAGYLTSAGLGNISIDAFSDVDLQSNAPEDGQVLTWAQAEGSDGKWVPLNIAATGGDVTLTSFSVGANASPNGGGGLAYSNTTGVFTYTPPSLSSYLTSTNLGTALNNVSINSLSDVNTSTTTPSNGNVLSWNGSNWVPAPAPSAGVTDGDKGDITVSSSGTVWTIDSGSVTYAKIQDVSASSKLLGRYGTGAGDVQEISIGDGLSLNSSTGVLTASGGGTATSVTRVVDEELGNGADLYGEGTSFSREAPIQAKSFSLLKIKSNHQVWVTLYTSEAAKNADASRDINTDPEPGTGVLAEAILVTETDVGTGVYEQAFTPAALCWNDNPTVGNTVWIKAQYLGTQPTITSVTIDYIPLEYSTITRETLTGTSASLATNASGNIDIPSAPKAYSLLKVRTSVPAWVVLYTTSAARAADASRTETTDSLPGSGVLAEVITTTDNLTQVITPGVFGWNDDSTIYLKVVNKSVSASPVEVTITQVPQEV